MKDNKLTWNSNIINLFLLFALLYHTNKLERCDDIIIESQHDRTLAFPYMKAMSCDVVFTMNVTVNTISIYLRIAVNSLSILWFLSLLPYKISAMVHCTNLDRKFLSKMPHIIIANRPTSWFFMIYRKYATSHCICQL